MMTKIDVFFNVNVVAYVETAINVCNDMAQPCAIKLPLCVVVLVPRNTNFQCTKLRLFTLLLHLNISPLDVAFPGQTHHPVFCSSF